MVEFIFNYEYNILSPMLKYKLIGLPSFVQTANRFRDILTPVTRCLTETRQTVTHGMSKNVCDYIKREMKYHYIVITTNTHLTKLLWFRLDVRDVLKVSVNMKRQLCHEFSNSCSIKGRTVIICSINNIRLVNI